MPNTPRMMDAQPEPPRSPQQAPHNPNLVPVSQFQQPRQGTASKKAVFIFLGVAAVGGTAAVIVSRSGKSDEKKTETADKDKDKEKDKDKKDGKTDTTVKKKWKTTGDGSGSANVVATPDPPKAGSAAVGSAGSGSGSARPPPIPGLPVEVDSTIVSEAFRDLKPEVAKCKSLFKTVIKITVAVNPDGSIKSAVLKDTAEARENPDPALAKCVIGHVNRAKFKKTQFGGTFDYPFLF